MAGQDHSHRDLEPGQGEAGKANQGLSEPTKPGLIQVLRLHVGELWEHWDHAGQTLALLQLRVEHVELVVPEACPGGRQRLLLGQFLK